MILSREQLEEHRRWCIENVDALPRTNEYIADGIELADTALHLYDENERLRKQRDKLRTAFGAYRSALRCGEAESAQLKQVGDAAVRFTKEEYREP